MFAAGDGLKKRKKTFERANFVTESDRNNIKVSKDVRETISQKKSFSCKIATQTKTV